MVIIYGTEWCIYCIKAKNLVKQHDLNFEFRDVDNPDIKAQLTSLLPDYKTIPQIWWHGIYIGNYDNFVLEIENTRNFAQDGF